MFKRFGQVHVVFARHSNWLVKVASNFAVAFGGITGLNLGVTLLFLWLCGSPRPSTQVRLQMDWPFGKLHSRKWSKERRTAWFLRRNHKHS